MHSNTWKTAEKARECMILFEKKHKHYFQLFKMESYQYKKLSANFYKSMEDLKKGKCLPALREIYAASEMLNRKILLVKEVCGNNRAIAVCPLLLGFSEETESIKIEIKGDNTAFRCITVHKETDVINKGHEFCLDKRFRNSFALLHDGNYFPSIEHTENKPFFEIFGTLIYGFDSGKTSNADIMKMCLAEHEEDKDIKEIYSEFVDFKKYSSDKEQRKYEIAKEGKERNKLLHDMQKEGLAAHVKNWKSLTQGDCFAITSIFGFVLYLEEDKWHMIRRLCSGMMQTIKGSFCLKRKSDTCFEVDANIKADACLCKVEPPLVSGILNDAERMIAKGISKLYTFYKNGKMKHV
jgi:hypothetical protein